MPTPALSTESKTGTTDARPSQDSWYSAFTSAPETTPQPAEPQAPAEDAPAYPDVLDTLTPADIPGPHARAVEAPWQTLIIQQHDKLDRLARENERLMDRIDTLLQNQEREQVFRQQLQNQVEHMRLATAHVDVDTVRREARAGVTEELKPVLLAILDALERFVRKPASEPEPAAPSMVALDASALDARVKDDPYLFEDYGRLPAILTRPLNELMDDIDDPGRSGSGGPKAPRPRKTPFHNRKRPRTRAPGSDRNGGPGPFTWTTVFLS